MRPLRKRLLPDYEEAPSSSSGERCRQRFASGVSESRFFARRGRFRRARDNHSALGNGSSPFFPPPCSTLQLLPVSTSLRPHSLFPSPQQSSVSSRSLQHSSTRFNAAISTQALRPPLTESLGTQDSLTLSLQEQKMVLTTFLNEYKIALGQAEMKISEQGVCISTLTSAYKGF